ncbi:MAG: PTS glucose transporter subunit IIA [Idiomarina piscisalsi]|nr:PTS glucose transporter subunit IIA [Idiomarina piscisalsi]
MSTDNVDTVDKLPALCHYTLKINTIRGSNPVPQPKLPLIYAPITGRVQSAHSTSAIAGSELLGSGLQLSITGSTLYAPVSGELLHLSQSGDYIAIKINEHFSVQLIWGSGEQYLTHDALKVLCRHAEQVEQGTPLMSVNLPRLRSLPQSQQGLSVLLSALTEQACELPIHWQQTGRVVANETCLNEEPE